LYNVVSHWLYLKEYINDARSHERQKKLYNMFFIFDKYLLSAAIQPERYDTSVVMW